ncbi:hypothetical protein OPQ81_003867 [Rhizoctonia solani]|nr:hypothetical protein OPQ81_003867 [Rhizoctonia solani]
MDPTLPSQYSCARSMTLAVIGPTPELRTPSLALAIPQPRAGTCEFGHRYLDSVHQRASNAIRPTKNGLLPNHKRFRTPEAPMVKLAFLPAQSTPLLLTYSTTGECLI